MKKFLAPVLAAAAAFLGISPAPAPAPAAGMVTHTSTSDAVVPEQRSRRSLAFPQNFSGFPVLTKPSGLTPKEWGCTSACRRMVRKSHMRRLGIAGRKI